MGHQMMRQPPLDMLTTPVNNPFVLDALWSIFYATGEKEPIRRISSAAVQTTGRGRIAAEVRLAARNSLVANGRESERVREILAEIAAEYPGAGGDPLRNLLQSMGGAG